VTGEKRLNENILNWDSTEAVWMESYPEDGTTQIAEQDDNSVLRKFTSTRHQPTGMDSAARAS
jgi:hypothetical protein